MKLAAILLLALLALVSANQDAWHVVEEDEEPYNEEYTHHRATREIAEEANEHARLKRSDSSERVRRSPAETDYVRKSRQIHQYEVHEIQEDDPHPGVTYEEMLAAGAEHHNVYAAPGAGKSARYLNSNPNEGHNTLGVHDIPSQPHAQAVAPAKLGQNGHANPAVPANTRHSPDNFDGGFVAVSGGEPQPQAETHLTEDQAPAAGQHYPQKHHGFHRGGGHQHQGDHYGVHGGKGTKGSQSNYYSDKGAKGFKKDENHRKEYEEAAGKKHKHHDHAGHEGSHEEEAHGSRGSNFAEKKGHKKGHKTKGYHNKYHKDEFHKEHKFYDDFHKSGEHHRFGKFNAKHASNESGKKKAHHVNAGHDFMERGKKGYSNKGHLDADHKGYHGKSGHEDHNEHHSQHAKKGGKEGGSHWGYAHKN